MLSATAAATFAFSGSDLVAKFNEWKNKHAKAYTTTELESQALATFSHNEAIIHEHNSGNWTFTLGHNQFSDLTFEEFQQKHMAGGMALFTNKAPKNMERVFLQGEATPKGYKAADSLDWVAKGAVTPVKNQAQCGSCWAFSTTGSMEGAIFVQTGTLESLSEQEPVSCDKVDHGCQGGAMDNGFTFAKTNGLPLEKDYPYTSGTGSTGTCKSSTFTAAPHSKVASFTDVTPNSEAALKAAVAKQPVSVAIEADKQVFQFYKSGVINASAGCGTNLDHGVLAVGYGTQDGTMYWKVKNSR